MKTKHDLDALTDDIVADISRQPHDIGYSGYETDEDGNGGYVERYADNSYTYERDGWTVGVEYECCGTYSDFTGDRWTPSTQGLSDAWGRVTELWASHSDPTEDDERVFTDEELADMRTAIDNALRNL